MSKAKEKLFRPGDAVVYPSHGVGTICAEESQVISGVEMKLYVITFDKDKMTLRVPKNRAEKAGLRHLSTGDELKKALKTLQGRAKISKGMWSKRAQEYETKINSGSINLIAEVIRDLHRNIDDPARSYSERMIYESALQRLANEYAVSEKIDIVTANSKLKQMLDDARELYKDAA